MLNTQSNSEANPAVIPDKQIGDIIREAHNLSADQVEQVLAHQKQSGLKFGEAAIALGLLQRDQVLWALSQQFQYSYSQEPNLMPELVVANKPFSEHAEVFRDLRSQLLANQSKQRSAIAVISSDIGDGKSYFAANLAVAFSQLGGRTLLVDADMRTPRQQDVFQIQANSGLSSVLAGRSVASVIKPAENLPNLYLLPVGVTPPNPTELVQRPVLGLLLKDLLERFDYVIVDTPAAIHGADAKVIAATCGQALIVGRQGRSRLSAIKTLSDSVQRMGANVLGIVMNQYSA